MASAVENIFDDSYSDSGDDFVGFSREEAQQHLDRLNAMELEIDLEEDDKEESDNDNEQPGEPFINWNTDESKVSIPDFTEHVSPTKQMPRDATPLQFFMLFFTSAMIEMITGYTNHNAIELINQANTNRAILNWEEVTTEELMAFLGIVILMGIVKLPASQLYWSQDDRLHQRGVTRIFPRDRFDYILKYFYCNDPQNIPHKDDSEYKLYRVKPVLEELSKKFLELYDPHRAQSIDEAMVKFKGCLKFLQYMPMKPIKRGIKIWCRCDSEKWLSLPNGCVHGEGRKPTTGSSSRQTTMQCTTTTCSRTGRETCSVNCLLTDQKTGRKKLFSGNGQLF